MSLVAVCPNCHVENNATNVRCDVCQTALGAVLVDQETATGMWLVKSAGLTVAMILPCWVLDFHPGTLFLAMFYGPLLASYFARTNVVWRAAVGGVAGVAALLLLIMLLEWHTARALLDAVLGGAPAEDEYGVVPNARAHLIFGLVFGVPLSLAAVLPVSLTGAAVGELLSQRRRLGRGAAISTAAPAAPLTDDELAKVKL